MTRASLVLAVLAASLMSIVLPRLARAESPNSKAVPIYVLSLLTDDADDQADALTQALRARVKQAPGWSLLETPQSLETLTIALRCPPRPDAPCLQRIGDQLHSDHYVWGSLGKKKGGEVSADLHFWTRGKPQVDASEAYSENMKDPGDEGLRAVAARLFAQLTGGAAAGGGGGGAAAASGGPTGTLLVHAGEGGGSVMVDGAEKATLQGGEARMELAEGPHKVTVHVPGFDAPALITTIKAGGEQDVSFALAPAREGEGGGEAEPATSKPFPLRKVVAYSSLGVAAVFLTVAIVEAFGWKSDKDANDNDRASIPATVTDACGVVGNVPYAPAAADACDKSNDAKTKSAIAWVTGGAGLAFGGVGVWLLTTDHSATADSSAARAPARGRVAVTPMLGPNEGGLRLKVSF